jgi:hypothetical protein
MENETEESESIKSNKYMGIGERHNTLIEHNTEKVKLMVYVTRIKLILNQS